MTTTWNEVLFTARCCCSGSVLHIFYDIQRWGRDPTDGFLRISIQLFGVVSGIKLVKQFLCISWLVDINNSRLEDLCVLPSGGIMRC